MVYNIPKDQVTSYIISQKSVLVNIKNTVFWKKEKKGIDILNKWWYNIMAIRKSKVVKYAGMAELADARDLKSREINFSYRFDPGFRHQSYRGVEQSGSSSGS